ncbi:MAG: hypothetical protein IJ215_03450 [Clostridia bacterium]|nr:hypothetical protein [Clostridia bacterium]
MKKNFKIILTSVIIGMLIGGATFVAADASVQAILNGQIKVTLDGELQEFRDESTNAVQLPLTYRDRTYLPMRTLANLVGVSVDYDATTNTAILKTGENHTLEMKEIKKALLDNDWVRENLYLKGSYDVWHTDIWFEPMANGTVFTEVKSYYSSGYALEYFLIYYQDDKVKAKSIEVNHSEDNPGVISYEVDREKSIVCRDSFIVGTDVKTYYSINSQFDLEEFTYFRRVEYAFDPSERVYENGDLIIDYDINIEGFTLSGRTRFSPFIWSIERYEKQYNFVWIRTPLTEENLQNLY